jgi:non-ribosomal peptide synthetase component F
MDDMFVNWALLTPSIGELLSTENLPQLTTSVLAGESMSLKQIDDWTNKPVRRINAYRATECSVLSSFNLNVTSSTGPFNIGVPGGCRYWIVSPSNHLKLVPVGYVEELLIEGPTIGRGYLG